MQRILSHAAIAILLPVILAACGSAPAPAPVDREAVETEIIGTARGSAPAPVNPNAGRYSIQQDRAPDRTIQPSAVSEVVPEPTERTLAGNRNPYTVLGKTYYVLPSEVGYRERGIASWYGEKFHGHKTSNGEIFDMYQATAAHKSLPIPSFLRVTNLDNNRSIVVRVNDRGPFHGDRLIDLSYAAALKLGYVERGTARVQLEAIVAGENVPDENVPGENVAGENIAGDARADKTVAGQSTTNQEMLRLPPGDGKYLQVGAFAKLGTAQEVSNRLREITSRPVFIRPVNSRGSGLLHRVRIGPVNDPGEIRRLAESVIAADLGSPYTVTE